MDKKEKVIRLNNYINSIEDEIVKKSSFESLIKWGVGIKTHIFTIDKFWNILFKINLQIFIFSPLFIIPLAIIFCILKFIFLLLYSTSIEEIKNVLLKTVKQYQYLTLKVKLKQYIVLFIKKKIWLM